MKAWKDIEGSNLFRLNGPEIDLCETIEKLVSEIKGSEEDWYSWGEFGECSAPDFIIGAYWALAEYHGGQWSDEYAAMCSLGTIFSPGMASGPEPDSGEQYAYDAVCEYFNKTLCKGAA